MVADLLDMSQPLPNKLGQLLDPAKETGPRYDVASQFPSAWRSLV